LPDDFAALIACQRCPVERELLGDGAIHLIGQVTRTVLLEELGAELRDALVMDATLEVRIRVIGERGGRWVSRPVAADDRERCSSVALA
jgi:hypothetical protein